MKAIREVMDIELPEVGYSDFKFDLQRSVSRSESGGRLANIIEYADPRWVMTATTRGLRYSDAEAFKAWWQQLQGGLKSVIIKSPYYCRPRAHIMLPGEINFTGELLKVEGNTLTIDVRGNDIFLSPGDYISFNSEEKYFALGQVTDTPAALDIITVNIEPALPGYIKIGSIVYFNAAMIRMRPLWDSFEYTSRPLRSFTFTMIESRL